MNHAREKEALAELVALAIAEDFGQLGDITAQAVLDESQQGDFSFRSRQLGILSGSKAVEAVAQLIDSTISINWLKVDGEAISPEEKIATISGNLRSILQAERICLNFLSHLSGIATQTRNYVDILAKSGSKSIIRDTRKTTPGYRYLEKAAVEHGGGQNHRMGLYDAFLIKDNHLSSVSIKQAISKCRDFSKDAQLEIEVDSLDQLEEVVPLKPDLILLDNFAVGDIGKAIVMSNGIKLEVSGGITLDNLVEFGSTNVDFIAIGALTHSVKALDIGLDAM